jgi:hypothetical protein
MLDRDSDGDGGGTYAAGEVVVFAAGGLKI